MTAIKKLIDGGGNQCFPQTHMAAVVDEDGNSVKSVLDMQTQLINQAQMAQGDVPSDIAPIEGSSNWVTSGGIFNAVNTNIRKRFIGEREVPIPVTTKTPSMSNTGVYDGNSYSSRLQIKVIAGARYTILGNASYNTTACFLTQSDASVSSGNASITSDGTVYTLTKNIETTITAPFDAEYLVINAYLGTTSSNKYSIKPQSIRETILAGEWMESVDAELLYSETTEEISTSSISSYSYGFNDVGRYYGTSSTKHYRMVAKPNITYTVTAGETAIYMGWLKSTATQTTNTQADLSIIDNSVRTIPAGTSVTATAPSDAVRIIFSAIPASVSSLSQKGLKQEVSDINTHLDSLDNGLAQLEVPLNYLTIPNTTYKYTISTITGQISGTYEQRRVAIPITAGKTYRCTTNNRSNFFVWTTGTGSGQENHTYLPIVEGSTGYSVAANSSIDITAPEGAIYLCTNVVDANVKDCTPVVGEVLSLKEYLTTPHNLDNIFDLNPDVDVRNKLAQLKRPLNMSDSGTSGVTPLSILHLSDVHSDKKSWDRMIEFKNKYKQYINAAICTGDLVEVEISSDKTFLENGGDGVMLVMGNHDVAKNTWNSYTTTSQECYDAFLAPYIESWGVTYEANKCYYYKDFTTQMIRLIVIDATTGANSSGEHWNSTQLEWLTNLLADARTNGYSVIIATHYWAVTSSGRTYVDCTFNCKTVLSEGEMVTPSAALTAVQDFIDAGGSFICWLSGHTHRDFVYYPTSYPKQLGIVINCAAGYITSATKVCDEARVSGTKSIDCFNIYGFDTTRKLIKIVRIGSDRDSQMRHKGTMTIKYGGSTPVVVFND